MSGFPYPFRRAASARTVKVKEKERISGKQKERSKKKAQEKKTLEIGEGRKKETRKKVREEKNPKSNIHKKADLEERETNMEKRKMLLTKS